MKKILILLLMIANVYAHEALWIELSAEIKTIDNEKFIEYKLHNPNKENVYFIPSGLTHLRLEDVKNDNSLIKNCLPKIKRKPYTIKDCTKILPQQTIIQKINLNKLFECRKNLHSRYRIYYISCKPSFGADWTKFDKLDQKKYYNEYVKKVEFEF